MKGSKRARSPDDHSPIERPLKRYSLDTSSSGLRQSASANSSRHPSEDWVKQTGGLTIDSPILQTFVELNEPQEDGGMSQDIDMVVEPQFEGPVMPLHRPQLHPLHTTNIGINVLHHSDIPMSTHHLQPFDNTDTTKTHGPAIKLIPPTPMSVMGQPSFSFSESAPPPNLSPMSTSPLTPGGTARKHKFTMGPRADCEKCRLGIKGHWVHLD
ncbi:hypothetical protein BDQ17DRAFT_1421592 [Cyathus striatus]|nr:hypothetical protein BDQ17DRAFT_1421592 [Cyathus striatus]